MTHSCPRGSQATVCQAALPRASCPSTGLGSLPSARAPGILPSFSPVDFKRIGSLIFLQQNGFIQAQQRIVIRDIRAKGTPRANPGAKERSLLFQRKGGGPACCCKQRVHWRKPELEVSRLLIGSAVPASHWPSGCRGEAPASSCWSSRADNPFLLEMGGSLFLVGMIDMRGGAGELPLKAPHSHVIGFSLYQFSFTCSG